MHILTLALAASLTTAHAQTLETAGDCPGVVDITVSGLAPDTNHAFLFAGRAGSDLIPLGPCAFTRTGLGGLRFGFHFTSDADGASSWSPSVPEAACSTYFQIIDTSSCTLTPAVIVSGDQDGDGIPDADDVCPGFSDPADEDGDGIHEGCPISVVIGDGYGAEDLQAFLIEWGFTADIVPGEDLAEGFDLSGYDVIATMYNTAVPDPAWLATEADALGIGIIAHRGDELVDSYGLGSATLWQDGAFAIDDNDHFITAPFAVGGLDLSFTFKTRLDEPHADTRVLGSSPDPSLVASTTMRRVTSPYYGHTIGMPWNGNAALLTWRIYMWAAGAGTL